MIRLSIVEITDPYCRTHSEGEQVFRTVAPYLRRQEHVELDFDQVELASSSFFNELFGSIIEGFGEDFVEGYLSYASLKP